VFVLLNFVQDIFKKLRAKVLRKSMRGKNVGQVLLVTLNEKKRKKKNKK